VYRIDLDIDPGRESYSGEVSIRLDIARSRRSIELHAVEMRVQRATWRGAGRREHRRPRRA